MDRIHRRSGTFQGSFSMFQPHSVRFSSFWKATQVAKAAGATFAS